MTPFYADDWLKVYGGDCREVMRSMEPESVHCVVTSPPYWGLRDYGNAAQLGLEPTPEEYVANMVDVFREVRRVLRSDGTVWLNLGDSYYRDPKRGDQEKGGHAGLSTGKTAAGAEKNLVGVPWRVALALQEDGWILRCDVIWNKPSLMPSSVRDRPTRSHEYVFLLTRSPRYWYDADAIAEPAADSTMARWRQNVAAQAGSERAPGKTNGTMRAVGGPHRPQAIRAAQLASEAGLTEAHFAAIRSVGITDTGKATIQTGTGKNRPEVQALADEAKVALGGYYREFLTADTRNARTVWTIANDGYDGDHYAVFPEALPEKCILAGCPPDGTVLDPFAGSGTTGKVANRHSRRAVLIDLNPDYLAQAMTRNRDIPLGLEVA
jgi:DNA modification methylase